MTKSLFFKETLQRLETSGLYRTLQSATPLPEGKISIGGRVLLNFSSNDYLGLSQHPALKEAAVEATRRWGVGAGASRLITGNHDLYEQLETRIARFKGSQAALVFSSGYMANLGVISAIIEKDDRVFSDALNHASIIDACRMSRGKLFIYRHQDTDHLEELLAGSSREGKAIIISDGVFSMDGDTAPLKRLLEIRDRYDALLILDDAHATGVLGERGRGLAEHLGITSEADITIGTFSKAFGSYGAFATGSREVMDFLINRARSLIFSTALPPAVLATNLAAVDLVENLPTLRQKLLGNSRCLSLNLRKMGFNVPLTETAIVPVIVGENKRSLELGAWLFEQGILAKPIRPPTVPPGAARLRVAASAAHSEDDLHRALSVFEEAAAKFI